MICRKRNDLKNETLVKYQIILFVGGLLPDFRNEEEANCELGTCER